MLASMTATTWLRRSVGSISIESGALVRVRKCLISRANYLKKQNQLIFVFLKRTFEGFISSWRLILVRMHFQRQFSVRLFNVAIARRFFDAEDFVVIFSSRKDFVNLHDLFRSEVLLHGLLGSWWCRFSLTSGWFWWWGFVLNENKNKVQIKTWKTLA